MYVITCLTGLLRSATSFTPRGHKLSTLDIMLPSSPIVKRNNLVAEECGSLNLPSCSRRRLLKNTYFLSTNGNDGDNKGTRSKTRKPSGVYSRPSAAIERGSGFYVPGLEGSRVRSLFGIFLVALCYINHTVGSPNAITFSQTLSESVTYIFGMLLFLQGLVEFGKESGFVVKSKEDQYEEAVSSSSSVSLTQVASSSLTEECIESLQWIAASFISLTPATHVLLIETSSEDMGSSASILFQLGAFDSRMSAQQMNECIQATINAVYQSKGGRVSVPSTHPAANLIPDEYRRCVLLQRVDVAKDSAKRCFVIGSNQLLPAFAKNDLKWLGSLAKYAQLEMQ